MKTSNVVKVAGALGVVLLLVAAQARAIVAYDFPGTMVGNQSGGPYILGNEFVVNTPIYVNGVGAFDSGNDGFWYAGNAVTIPVAIYQEVSGQWNQVSGSAMSFSGNDGSLVGSARFQYFQSPVTLGVGTYAIVAANYGANGAMDWNANVNPGPPSVTFQTLSSAISMASGNYSFYGSGSALGASLSGLTYGNWGNPKPSFAGATFDFTPVPEAETFGAAAVGLLGLVYLVRQVRMRRKIALA